MAKANPKAWFTSHIAKISYKPVDKYARQQEKWRPFFPTWSEAHSYMLNEATDRLGKAQKELKRATAFHEKIKAMKEPTNG